MSSAKRPYNETISFNSINDNNNNNDYIVNVEESQEDEGNDMDVEHDLKGEQISKNDSPKNQVEGESFINSRRKRLNTDKDTFSSHPFPSNLNNGSFQLSSSTSRNSLNYYSMRNTTSPPSRNTITTTNVTFNPLSGSNYISPRDSFNNNTYDNSSKVSETTKSLTPVDLLMSSPPISTLTPKTNQTKSASNSSLTLTTSDSVTWSNDDFNPYSFRSTARTQINTNTSNSSLNTSYSTSFDALPTANTYSSLARSKPKTYEDAGSSGENTNNNFDNDNINNVSSNDDSINNLSSNDNDVSSNNDNTDDSPSNNDNINFYSSTYNQNFQRIRTTLTKNETKGPFKLLYSQFYDNSGIVIDSESFSILIQLYEFCDSSSTRLQSNVTSILGSLVLLLTNQIDSFDIPFIEHHKWNGSSFYGSVDVITLLDQLDDGLGLSSAEYVNEYNMRIGSVLQCGYRKTIRNSYKNYDDDNFTSQVHAPSFSTTNNDLQNNELRHAVMSEDDEREAQRLLELLAEEEDVEDNDTVQEGNSTEQDSSSEQESDSFTEISKDDYDDDDSLIQNFASTSIRQPTDTFGNPINPTRTTSIVTRRISRPVNNDGNETDDSLDDDLDNGNSSESAFEEVEFSDVESVATDSTVEDGWQNISRNI